MSFILVILKVGEYYNVFILDKIVLRDIVSNFNKESGVKILFFYKVKGGFGFNYFYRLFIFFFSFLNVCF